jgi:hypothetical protein
MIQANVSTKVQFDSNAHATLYSGARAPGALAGCREERGETD